MITKASKEFIEMLNNSKSYKPAAEMIQADIEKFKNDITNMVLNKEIELDGRWTDYELTDINITYQEDMLKLVDILDMYGIRKDLPGLKADDIALITSYTYTYTDILGKVADIINLFHVTIKGTKGELFNTWLILHDED